MMILVQILAKYESFLDVGNFSLEEIELLQYFSILLNRLLWSWYAKIFAKQITNVKNSIFVIEYTIQSRQTLFPFSCLLL